MADFPKRIGPTQLTNVATTLHAVPGDRTFTVRNIHVANESLSPARFTLSIGTDGTGKRLYRNVELQGSGADGGGGAFDWSGYMPLDPGEIMQGFADVSGALTITISGVDTT